MENNTQNNTQNNNPLIQEVINGRRDDLENQDLSNAVLKNIDLRDANLEETNLEGADLEGADLEGANLRRANLTNANLTIARLEGADLAGAHLTEAKLIQADLEGANLRRADLRRADLTSAYLREADLTDANLEGADLYRAIIEMADLTDANLEGADLTDATLRGADLTGADVTGADLTGADLTEAILTNIIGLNLVPIVHPIIDPYQVHRESTKINYSKLIEFLKEKLNGINIPENINYASYINETISKLILDSNEPQDKKTKQQEGLHRIMNERLNGFNYGEMSQNTRNSIYYVLEYVKLQPSDFQKIYIDNWIESCVTDAYEGIQLSCVAGVIERFIFALSNACIISLSSGENAEYDMINSIIRHNPDVLITEYIQDWYKLHKTGSENAFPPETTEAQKKENLKKYLLELLPDAGELIDTKIVEFADNIGYEEDDFSYGGRRRRKNRKTTKKIRSKSNKKRKTIKRRKTMRVRL